MSALRRIQAMIYGCSDEWIAHLDAVPECDCYAYGGYDGDAVIYCAAFLFDQWPDTYNPDGSRRYAHGPDENPMYPAVEVPLAPDATDDERRRYSEGWRSYAVDPNTRPRLRTYGTRLEAYGLGESFGEAAAALDDAVRRGTAFRQTFRFDDQCEKTPAGGTIGRRVP